MIAEATQVGTMPLYFIHRYRGVNRHPITRRKAVSRNLFGKVNASENERFLRENNTKILDKFQHEWGFDVRTEKPVPNDRYKWFPADVKCCDEDKKENVDDNAEEKVSSENKSSGETTIVCSSQPPPPPASVSAVPLQSSKLKLHQQQSKMTDFLKVKKRCTSLASETSPCKRLKKQ